MKVSLFADGDPTTKYPVWPPLRIDCPAVRGKKRPGSSFLEFQVNKKGGVSYGCRDECYDSEDEEKRQRKEHRLEDESRKRQHPELRQTMPSDMYVQDPDLDEPGLGDRDPHPPIIVDGPDTSGGDKKGIDDTKGKGDGEGKGKGNGERGKGDGRNRPPQPYVPPPWGPWMSAKVAAVIVAVAAIVAFVAKFWKPLKLAAVLGLLIGTLLKWLGFGIKVEGDAEAGDPSQPMMAHPVGRP